MEGHSSGFLPKGALVFVIILLLLNAAHWIWVYSILLQRGIP